MMMYKKLVCFLLVFSYPIYLLLNNFAATVQEYRDKGDLVPMTMQVVRVCVWGFVLWFLFLYIKYCYGYYKQCVIRYSPAWSAKVEKMGRCVCLDPELPVIDASHADWPETDEHVTSEPANQTPEMKPVTVSHSQTHDRDEANSRYISKSPSMSSSRQSETDHNVTSEPASAPPVTVSHPQAPGREESNPRYIPEIPFKPLSMRSKGLGRVHGVFNLALARRQRRDFIGPSSPLTPLGLTDPPYLSSRYSSVMGLALAQRQRKAIIGPRAPLTSISSLLFTSHPASFSRCHSVMDLALAQRQRRVVIGPSAPLTPLLLTSLPASFSRCRSVMDLALAQRQRRDLIGPRPLLTSFLLTDAEID